MSAEEWLAGRWLEAFGENDDLAGGTSYPVVLELGGPPQGFAWVVGRLLLISDAPAQLEGLVYRPGVEDNAPGDLLGRGEFAHATTQLATARGVARQYLSAVPRPPWVLEPGEALRALVRGQEGSPNVGDMFAVWARAFYLQIDKRPDNG